MGYTFKKLSELSFMEAHGLFNRGFEGYLIPMNLGMDQFIGRFGTEGLSVDLSVAAFEGDLPVGFVLQGIREEDGHKISWNGGTGIIPEYRGKKLGPKLMEAAEQVLVDNGVEIATLEALSNNEPAIGLYEKCGYKIVDQLVFLAGKGRLSEGLTDLGEYELERFPALQAVGSKLFPALVPWQTAPGIVPKNGGEVVVLKKDGEIAGSCLIRRKAEYGKNAEGITLFQAEHRNDPETAKILLAHALEFDKDLTRNTYNFATGDGSIVSMLLEAGFEETPISQVFMVKHL